MGIRDWLAQPVLDRLDLTMATLQDLVTEDTDLQAEVQTIAADVAAALAKLADVEAQLAALQSGGLTAEQQAIVDGLATDLQAAHDTLAGTDTTIQTALNP